MRALIVGDPPARGALAAARGLARAGWTVGVGSSGGRGLAASSRMTTFRDSVPSAADGSERFVSAVHRAVLERRYEVVFSSGDAEMLSLSAARERIPAVVPHGRHDGLVQTVDKLHLACLARSAGLRSPKTAEATLDELRAVDHQPLVVKARVPVVHGMPRLFETIIARDRAQAERRAHSLRSQGFVPIVQEHISGPLIALTLVIGRDGEVLARVQQRAERLHPEGAGVSVRATTVPVDESLAERARRLLRDLGWFGLAQLQLLQTADGEPVLIDLNARFYGSLALALAAGSNLPALWARAAIGAPVAPIDDATPGVRYQWLEGEWLRQRSERRVSRLRGLVSGLGYAKGAAHSIWARDDPGPAAREVASLARKQINSTFRSAS